jgi:hypothetical protein
VNSIKITLAVVAAMIHGILFSLYGKCRDKIQALHGFNYFCLNWERPRTEKYVTTVHFLILDPTHFQNI